jgi:putative transposase
MPNFRRNWLSGGTFFFTVVTAGRVPLFRDQEARRLLGDCLREERRIRPFDLQAVVLLPDHLHAIWTLPSGDFDYPIRWSSIKSRFTHEWLKCGSASESERSEAQRRERRRGIWQSRYMEHTIRDEDDWIQHANYIHFNPVRHGLARCPKDWPWSSFLRYVRSGDYPLDWGCSIDGEAPVCDRVNVDLVE